MNIFNRGYGVGVEARVGVGRSRKLWPESELESVKFYRLQLQSVVEDFFISSLDDNFI